jgi:hypothetical protein
MSGLNILHPRVVNSSNPADCVYLNGNHLVSGLYGFQELSPIVIPNGSSSFTIPNLNGDVDIEYILDGFLTYQNTNPDGNFLIRPNGVTANLFSEVIHWWSNTGNVLPFSDNVIVVGGYQTPIDVHFTTHIYASTGRFRRFYTVFDYITVTGSGTVNGLSTGWWKDNSTLLTSLVLSASAYTFGGTVNMYSRLPG